MFRYTYSIDITDAMEAEDCDSIFAYTMYITRIEENDDGDDELNEEPVGEISGLHLARDFQECSQNYAVLDSISGNYEGMAKCIQDIEEDDDYVDNLIGNSGYLLVNHVYFEPKFERSGIEQSAIKTLFCKLGYNTHGMLVHPMKEIRIEKDSYLEIQYDRSPEAIAYMQKIFIDVDFEPIQHTPYFAIWSSLKNKSLKKIPLVSKFKTNKKRFKVDTTKIYKPNPAQLDSSNVKLLTNFEDDIIYDVAEILRVSPESVVRNFLTDEIQQKSELLKHAEITGVDPLDIIRRDTALNHEEA
jgi:hypothetical protein